MKIYGYKVETVAELMTEEQLNELGCAGWKLMNFRDIEGEIGGRKRRAIFPLYFQATD